MTLQIVSSDLGSYSSDCCFISAVIGTTFNHYDYNYKASYNDVTFAVSARNSQIIEWWLMTQTSDLKAGDPDIVICNYNSGYSGIKLGFRTRSITLNQIRSKITFKQIQCSQLWMVGCMVNENKEPTGVNVFKGPDPETVLGFGIDRLYE